MEYSLLLRNYLISNIATSPFNYLNQSASITRIKSILVPSMATISAIPIEPDYQQSSMDLLLNQLISEQEGLYNDSSLSQFPYPINPSSTDEYSYDDDVVSTSIALDTLQATLNSQRSFTASILSAKMGAVLICDILGALCIMLNMFVISSLIRNRRRVLTNVFYVLVLHCAIVDLIRGGCLVAWGMPHLLINNMKTMQDRLLALKVQLYLYYKISLD